MRCQNTCPTLHPIFQHGGLPKVSLSVEVRKEDPPQQRKQAFIDKHYSLGSAARLFDIPGPPSAYNALTPSHSLSV